jgi:hypothetical protein
MFLLFAVWAVFGFASRRRRKSSSEMARRLWLVLKGRRGPMTEQEIKAIEENSDALKQTISILTQEKIALEERIAVLEAVQASLRRLLPNEKRRDHLLS